MSHAPERKEKDCLNCGTIVQGRYCQHCGQENTVPHESFLGLVQHFFSDITHFDGKFFTTLATLIRKPGFLPGEFMKGRRARYLNPIRMYVFTSALFFLIFFMLFSVDKIEPSAEQVRKETRKELDNLYRQPDGEAPAKGDSLTNGQTEKLFADSALADRNDTKEKGREPDSRWKFSTSGPEYKSMAQYDSEQALLPPSDRDGWLVRKLNQKVIDINQRYAGRQSEFWKDTINRFLHSIPYLLFVSLPLYALFLKLLYVRRKHFYYADHAIFLIHLYIFSFIVLLLVFGLSKLQGLNGLGWMWILNTALVLYGIIYTAKAMKRFYGQGWGKTLLKFFLFNILSLFAINALFAIFFVFTVYRN